MLGQTADGAVFVPVAQAVQLQRVQECAVLLQELVDQELVFFPADQIEVPHRVVEDDQHVRLVVEAQRISVRRRRWGCGVARPGSPSTRRP